METVATETSASFGYSRIAHPLHTAAVLLIQSVFVYRATLRMDQLRAATEVNRIQMYERTIFVELLMFGLAMAGVWLNGSPLTTLLGDRWKSLGEFARDAGIGVAFLFVTITLGSVLGPHGGGAVRGDVQFILPRGGMELGVWIVLSITAGFCEEALYRGYLQRQFAALTKNVSIGIILSAAAFGLSHFYQGFAAALQIGILGALTGILAQWRKTVRPGMIAHALQDIFGGLSGRMGH